MTAPRFSEIFFHPW